MFNFIMSFLVTNNCLLEVYLVLVISFLILLGLFFQRISLSHEFRNEILFLITVWALNFATIIPLAALFNQHYNVFTFGNIVFCDFLGLCIQLITILLFIIVLYVVQSVLFRELWIGFEFYVFYIFTLLGLVGMIISNTYLLFFVFMEVFAYSLYTIAGLVKGKSLKLVLEALFKYFILNAVISSTFILLGSAAFIFLTGSFCFIDLNLTLNSLLAIGNLYEIPAVWFGSLFFLGILMKLGVAPFHFHEPDVYEGLPYSILLIFTILPKLTFFYILYKFLLLTNFLYMPLLLFCGIVTIIVGCFGMLNQRKIKRFIAYSSINNIGFVLVSLVLGSTSSALLYLLVYLILNIGFIGCFIYFYSYMNVDGVESELIFFDDLIGLSKIDPILVNILLFFLLTFAGIPPLVGFWIKYYIILQLLLYNQYFLVILLLLFSVLSSIGYLRVIVSLYFNDYFNGGQAIYWNRAIFTWNSWRGFDSFMENSYRIIVVISSIKIFNFISIFGSQYLLLFCEYLISYNLWL